jgi:hypothetical protein
VTATVEILLWPVDDRERDLIPTGPTLARYLLALAPGSPCLCCGSPLLGASAASWPPDPPALFCSRCNAAIGSERTPAWPRTEPEPLVEAA